MNSQSISSAPSAGAGTVAADPEYGYSISSSPPMLSPSTTLSSLSPQSSRSPTTTREQHHSFPFFSSKSKPKPKSHRPPPPPAPSEISTLSRHSTLVSTISSPSTSSTTPLHHTQTQPDPRHTIPPSSQRHQRRHQSESAIPSLATANLPPDSPSSLSPPLSSPSSPPPPPPLLSNSDAQRRDSWFQKKPRNSSGSSPGGYGRHGNEWLFGSISLTQTAKELVARRAKKP